MTKVTRRSHKKSRTGCLQCKRRHVKCDESHPVCRLCANSGLECSFSSASASASASPTPFPSSPSPNPPPSNESPLDAPLNPYHLRLLFHLTNPPPLPPSKHMFNLSHHIGEFSSSLAFGMQTAFSHPYLLHALLAFSARHLAALAPDDGDNNNNHNRSQACSGSCRQTARKPRQRDEYLHLAVALQTRAVSLFNASSSSSSSSAAAAAAGGVVDGGNCVAVLLFSSVLGHHLLADMLARRDHHLHAGQHHQHDDDGGFGGGGGDGAGGGSGDGLDALLAHYVQCMDTHRGVYAVALAAWPLLVANEVVGPTIAASARFTSRAPRGSECAALGPMVEAAAGLAEAEREACRRALRLLQVGFDALAEAGADVTYRFQMLFSWTMLAPAELGRLLLARRPEALVLLGYYALLLHHGREMWQVGDAGRYLLGMVWDGIGEEWRRFLEVPRKIIARDYA